MDSISEKNQRFILEGLSLLSSLDDLKECEKEIFQYLKTYSEGSIIDKTELFKVIDNAEYFRVKTNDIVGTISLHISKVQYQQKDIEDKLTAVNKNAYVGDVTLPANIVTTDFLPEFNITIVNGRLRLRGLRPGYLPSGRRTHETAHGLLRRISRFPGLPAFNGASHLLPEDERKRGRVHQHHHRPPGDPEREKIGRNPDPFLPVQNHFSGGYEVYRRCLCDPR